MKSVFKAAVRQFSVRFWLGGTLYVTQPQLLVAARGWTPGMVASGDRNVSPVEHN